MKYSFQAAAWKKENFCFWSSEQSYCILVWFNTSNRRVWLRKHWAKSPVWPSSPSISEEMETKSEKIQISSYRMPTLFTFFSLIYKTEMQFFLKPTILKNDCIAAKHACKNTWCGFPLFCSSCFKGKVAFFERTSHSRHFGRWHKSSIRNTSMVFVIPLLLFSVIQPLVQVLMFHLPTADESSTIQP